MIYLDYLATTPCDPLVVEAMLPWFTERFGNPHSAGHAPGAEAEAAVEAARRSVAALLGVESREIVFTSGATEANNLAIKGAARFAGPGERRRVITLATEHACVLESVRELAAEGFEPVILPVGADGRLDLAVLRAALAVPTRLVSVMAVNNETGVVQDIAAIGAVARAAGALFHSDLAQAAGKMTLDLAQVDLASVSAHKLYGPKGIGALYVRRRPRVRLAPLFSGGGQERGLRPGTVPVPLAVGFGVACGIAAATLAAEPARVAGLRDGFVEALRRAIPGVVVNGAAAPRIAGCLSLRLPGAAADAVIAAAPELALSTGSACSSGDVAPSHVLTAMGLAAAEAGTTLRVGIGRSTSAADLATAADALARAWAASRVAPATPAEA